MKKKIILAAVMVLAVAGCNQYKQEKEGVPLEAGQQVAPHPMGDESMVAPMGAPHAGAPVPVTEKIEGIKKAAGGKTIAETYAEKANLVGKEVVVRGKVVKYNANIMGRNWVHIQDGSGTAGSNDLTVTTNDPTAVGDVVVVKGTAATGKDFGAGYKYDVILENATLTVEPAKP